MDHLRYKKIPQEMFVILQQFHLFVFVAHAYNDECLCSSSCTHCKSSIPYLIKKQLPSYLWENVFYLLSSKFPNMFRKPLIRSSTYCTIAQVNCFQVACLGLIWLVLWVTALSGAPLSSRILIPGNSPRLFAFVISRN